MNWPHCSSKHKDAVRTFSAVEGSKLYGEGFASGFAAFRDSGEFSDVCVVIAGKEHHLHSLILAYHSLFFRRAFSNGMRESSQRRLELSALEDPLNLLPVIIDYFYDGRVMLSDKTCFGLLALSRHLMTPKLEHYCRDFIRSRLDIGQCIQFLLEGVQYSDEQLQEDCIALFATNFATSYCQTAAGLPADIIHAILTHEALQVQCEAQVLLFVLDYIDSTEIGADAAAQLFQHVRLCYLSNERLVWLQQQRPSALPPDLLLQGTMQRLQFQDLSTALSEAPVQPRSSYCSNLQYGLPGGQEHVDVPVHHIWDLLAAKIRVKVSGVSEGRPRNIVAGSGDGEAEDRWFATSETAHPAPWIELHLPCNVVLLSLQNYTFTHGHHRSSYYRMQMWESQAGSSSCMRPGAKFRTLTHKQNNSHQQGNDYLVTLADWAPPKQDWRVLRLVGTGPQQDGVHRLSVKDMKLYGTVRINLMEQAEGLVIAKEQIQTALTQTSTGSTPRTLRPRVMLQSPTRTMPPVTQSLYHNQF